MRIIYGVTGTSLDHYWRSATVIRHLLASGHQVEVVTTGREEWDLLLPDVPIHHARKPGSEYFVTDDGREVKRPDYVANNRVLMYDLRTRFEAQMVISDFDTASAQAGHDLDLPVITLDHLHVLSRCTLDLHIPPSQQDNFKAGREAAHHRLPTCYFYIVSTFVPAKEKKRNTKLTGAVIPDGLPVFDGSASEGGEGPVVISADLAEDEVLADTLRRLGMTVEVMRDPRETPPKPKRPKREVSETRTEARADSHAVLLKRRRRRRAPEPEEAQGGADEQAEVEPEKEREKSPFAADSFMAPLVGAQALFSGGGYSEILCALQLGVPVFCTPRGPRFEQVMNALAVEKMGCGEVHERAGKEAVLSFLERLDRRRQGVRSWREQERPDPLAVLDRRIGMVEEIIRRAEVAAQRREQEQATRRREYEARDRSRGPRRDRGDGPRGRQRGGPRRERRGGPPRDRRSATRERGGDRSGSTDRPGQRDFARGGTPRERRPDARDERRPDARDERRPDARDEQRTEPRNGRQQSDSKEANGVDDGEK